MKKVNLSGGCNECGMKINWVDFTIEELYCPNCKSENVYFDIEVK